MSLRHLELRVPGRAQKHQLPRGDQQVRIWRRSVEAQPKIPPTSFVGGIRFGSEPQLTGKQECLFNRLLYVLAPLTRNVTKNFSQHQSSDGVIIDRPCDAVLSWCRGPGG